MTPDVVKDDSTSELCLNALYTHQNNTKEISVHLDTALTPAHQCQQDLDG